MEHEKSKYKKLCAAVNRVVFISNVNGIKAESGAQVNLKCIFLFILFQRMEFCRWFSIAISMNSLLFPFLFLLLLRMFRSLSICTKRIESWMHKMWPTFISNQWTYQCSFQIWRMRKNLFFFVVFEHFEHFEKEEKIHWFLCVVEIKSNKYCCVKLTCVDLKVKWILTESQSHFIDGTKMRM